jgi:hypothetical protein
MAILTNTFITPSAVGIREELFDAIWNISPMDRPLSTSIGRRSLETTHPEWQTDSLAAAAGNAVVQGDDIDSGTYAAVTPTVRVGNHTQISRKDFIISRTERIVNKAGRDDEVAYQVAKKGNELLRDIEFILSGNQASRVAAAAVAPLTGSVGAWIATNFDGGAGAAAAGYNTGTGLVVAYTPGSAQALTEEMFQASAQSAWTAGGNPTIAIMGGTHKRQISKFTNTVIAPLTNGAYAPVIQRTEAADGRILHTAIDVYSHDFGTLSLLPSRFTSAGDCLILDPTMWEIGWLTGIETHELAKTGDADKRMIVCEYALISKNQAASAALHDLS